MQANKPDNSKAINKAGHDGDSGHVITGGANYLQCLLAMIAQARREICLLSYNLDPGLYNRHDIADALKNFILISQHSRLRILLRNDAIAARGHRVVDLGRSLRSFVDFRVLGERQRQIQSDWLIIDQSQVLERPTPDSLEARFHPDNPALARVKHKQFDEWWQAGDAAVALRSLHFS